MRTPTKQLSNRTTLTLCVTEAGLVPKTEKVKKNDAHNALVLSLSRVERGISQKRGHIVKVEVKGGGARPEWKKGISKKKKTW